MKRKNNEKAFTLIELLAVIVILAVIALIAVPQVIKILNKARLSAAEDTTYGITKAAESYVADFMLKNNGDIPSETLEFSCNNDGCTLTTTLTGYELTNLNKIDFKGTKPDSGTVTISDSGKTIIATNLKINGFTCNYLNGESYCGKKEYNTGDVYTLGGYSWHVINDDGKYLTLLMDAGQMENMQHCASGNDNSNNCDFNGEYYQYSWDRSLIRQYLNNEFLNDIEDKIGSNKLIGNDICLDQSIYSENEYSYGGYLKNEIDRLGVICKKGYINDKVRLLSISEYYNLSPKYSDVQLPYNGMVGVYSNNGKVLNIDNIMLVEDTSWLYSASIEAWWISGSSSYNQSSFVKSVRAVRNDGIISHSDGINKLAVRPVITIQK